MAATEPVSMVSQEAPGQGATSPNPESTLTPEEAGQVVNDSEIAAMQAKSHITTPRTKEISKSTKDAVKQVTNSEAFEDACMMAAEDPAACAARLATLAKGELDAIVEFATICISGPVGHVGTRRHLKAVAAHLLDIVLEKNDEHCIALCAKGELLLPKQFFGKADPSTPMWILKEAYAYFCKADLLGSREGRFLRGRWLVTMFPVHNDRTKLNEGRRYVEEAANAGHARAYVFLAQCIEFAGRFGWAPKKANTDTKKVLEYYNKAADLGDGDALNDMGSSYATGYGELEYNFDEAVKYYVRAIKAGSLHAFDNLGTHYESGMSGKAPEKIDYNKAMHYYRQGAKMRCSKCAYNIASAYAEGMGDVIYRNPVNAEKYYKYCIVLADDENDASMANRALKDLVCLYICRIKTNMRGSECVKVTEEKLNKWLSKKMLKGTMNDVNKCIARAVKNKEVEGCTDLLGDENGTLVYDAAMGIVNEAKVAAAKDNEIGEGQRLRIKHMFGAAAQDIIKYCLREARAKRRRVTLE